MSLSKFTTPYYLLLITMPMKSRKMQVASKVRLFSNHQVQQNHYRGGYTEAGIFMKYNLSKRKPQLPRTN